jgi:hypothetical protein
MGLSIGVIFAHTIFGYTAMNRLLCAILLLLMIAPIAAQDAASFPVLDEAAIFADGVTVLEQLPVPDLTTATVETEQDDWQFVKRDEQFYLLNNVTGQLSPPIIILPYPGDEDHLLIKHPTISPDRRFVAFHDDYPILPPIAFMYHIYVFDTQTNQIHQASTNHFAQGIQLEWVGESTLLAFTYSDYGFQVPFGVYRVDVRDDSIDVQSIAQTERTFYLRDENRLLWAAPLVDRHGYATVYEYHIDTGEQRELLTGLCGEHEQVFCWVLWQESNIVALLDYDFVQAADSAERLTLFDIVTGQPLYSTELDSPTTERMGQHLVLCVDINSSRNLCDIHAVSLEDFSSVNIVPAIDFWVVSSPDERYIYLYTRRNDPDSTGIPATHEEIYDLQNGSLFSLDSIANIEVSFVQWKEENTLIVATTAATGEQARWHIRIDTLDEDNS